MQLGWAGVPAVMEKALVELARKRVLEPGSAPAQQASQGLDCPVHLRQGCFRRCPLAETAQVREQEQERKVMAARQAVSRWLVRSRLPDLGRRGLELRHLAVKAESHQSQYDLRTAREGRGSTHSTLVRAQALLRHGAATIGTALSGSYRHCGKWGRVRGAGADSARRETGKRREGGDGLLLWVFTKTRYGTVP